MKKCFEMSLRNVLKDQNIVAPVFVLLFNNMIIEKSYLFVACRGDCLRNCSLDALQQK